MVKAILYSKDYNYAIECSPKCGSRLLRNLFYKLHSTEQPTLSPEEWRHFYQYFKPPSDVSLASIPKFVIARNPYTRILSAFLNKYVNAKETKVLKVKLNQHGIRLAKDSFLHFLQALHVLKARGKLNSLDEHVEEQVNSLQMDSYTTLFRLESLNVDLPKAYQAIPSLAPLADTVQEVVQELEKDTLASNKTQIHDVQYEHDSEDMATYRWTGKETIFPPYWRFFGSLKVQTLIYNLYHRDFETFGYSKDSYPHKPPTV